MKRLIVGGPHDGQWHEDYMRPVIELPILPPRDCHVPYGEAVGAEVPPASITRAIYRGHRLTDSESNRQWLVFAPGDWTSESTFEWLIQNYSPRKVTP